MEMKKCSTLEEARSEMRDARAGFSRLPSRVSLVGLNPGEQRLGFGHAGPRMQPAPCLGFRTGNAEDFPDLRAGVRHERSDHQADQADGFKVVVDASA